MSFVDKRGKLRSQPKGDFLKSWSGVALLVDEQTKGIEKDYAVNRTKALLDQAKLPGAAVGLVLLMVHTFYYTNNVSSVFDYLFLLTKTLGIAVTIPLMIRLIDKENPFVTKLCHSQKAGSKANCAGILDSPAANFLGIFSWSEIGFLYFTALFFYLLLFQAHANVLIVGFALLAAPFTVYSLYYQWKVARQWCRLCLAVQAVLLLEAGLAIAFFSTYTLSPVTLPSILALLLVSSIVISAYSLLKPVLIEWKSFKKQLPLLNRIKYKPEVFQLLLKKNPEMDTAGIAPIQLGNLEGKHQLTIISNPTCGPCIKMHRKLFDLLEGKENVSLQEIFLIGQNESSRDYQIAECMVKLCQSTEITTAKEAIAAYYKDKDTKGWIQKYDQAKADNTVAKQALEQHITWCQEKKISSTPTILYNGYKFPKEYTLEDLDYLVE